MRLDKYICKSTDYSLIEALVLIENRRARVNGIVILQATHQVHQNNHVLLDGELLVTRQSRYFMLNKPIGTICSNKDEAYPSALKLLQVDRLSELHIAGRLDADTSGLVLITDDGHWSFNLTSPKNKCEKVYKVGLTRPLASNVTARFQEGLMLQGETKLTLPAQLNMTDQFNVLLTLTEGRFHQVKRMFAAVGNKVKTLHRQQIGGLVLDVAIGQSRGLTQNEIDTLSVNSV